MNPAMHFDRFDICEAVFLFASAYHCGQGCPVYRLLGRLDALQFRPAPSLSVATLSDNGKAIYAHLVRSHTARRARRVSQ
jgi:hypothetical protein